MLGRVLVILTAVLLATAVGSQAASTVPSKAAGQFPKYHEVAGRAQDGDAAAQYKLADYHYAVGEFSQAAWWYGQAANQDHSLAQTALANCYAQGRGVKRDARRAAYWASRATHQKALANTSDTLENSPAPSKKPELSPSNQARPTVSSSATPEMPESGLRNDPEGNPMSPQSAATEGIGLIAPPGLHRGNVREPLTVVPRVRELEAPDLTIHDYAANLGGPADELRTAR